MKFVLTLAAALALPAASFSQEIQYLYPGYAKQISARYRTDINDFPSLLVEAFVLVHDKRFYDRPAWKSNVTRLLGQLFLSSSSSSSNIDRRLEVMAMSIEIGKIHTHEAILAALLDSIFFGHQCYGAHDAALGLYGRPLSQMKQKDLLELALLPRFPSRYFNNPSNLQEAVGKLASYLAEKEVISKSDLEAIKAAPPSRFDNSLRCKE